MTSPLLATIDHDNGPMQVVLIDDHELVRDGLRAMIQRESDMEVVGDAATLAEGIRRVAYTRPDLVILDVSLPDGSGVDGCAKILKVSPETRVILLTGFADVRARERAMENGASGFLLKRANKAELLMAMRRVSHGESVFEDAPRHPDDPFPRLTSREHDILALVAAGKTNREIAEELYLAEKTIKNYVSTILTKLGVEHRAGAAALYARYDERLHAPPPPGGWDD